MSDQLPPTQPLTPSHRDDPVRETLNALRVDADGCGLSDPASVRRRGQVRTRHQVAASVCAAVVAVAVVVTGGALLGGQADAHHRIIPATPTPTPSPTSLGLAADPFQGVADAGPVGNYKDLQRSPDAFVYQPKLDCMQGPGAWGASESRSQLFFSERDATFYAHVLRYRDAAAATAGVHEIESELASCTADKTSLKGITVRGPEHVPGAANAAHASYNSAANKGSEVSYYELGIRQVENVLVVLEWSSQGNPGAKSDWVWTADRLNLAGDRATT